MCFGTYDFQVVEVVNPKGAVAASLDIQCHLLHTWATQYGGQQPPSTSSSSNSSSEQPDSFKSGFLNVILSPVDAALYVGLDRGKSFYAFQLCLYSFQRLLLHEFEHISWPAKPSHWK